MDRRRQWLAAAVTREFLAAALVLR
eukprot:COSAG06_NODE_36686_length_444_cov_0.739130_1_plen_24_part_10